ncbi:813_t:CDS:2 [Ambispora gerdemannii]|uniref:813_t:CDS:1 n=1 Tax=Ambispora gerdemannii TaxID=144530 RepID=A0A9N9DUL0_9GLOM|nr:813_t:CDS:2 [Ambispora gerdemannii]
MDKEYTVNQLQDDYFTDEDLEESWSTNEEDIEEILPEDNNDEKEEHNIDRKIPVIETKK